MAPVMWLGSLLIGRTPKALGGIASIALLAIVGLGITTGIKSCSASRAEEARDQALRDLGACKQVNRENAIDIAEINTQAAANLAAAELERERALRAEAQLNHEQENADARYRAEIAALRDALVGDECADRAAPADVDRLFREPAARPD